MVDIPVTIAASVREIMTLRFPGFLIPPSDIIDRSSIAPREIPEIILN